MTDTQPTDEQIERAAKEAGWNCRARTVIAAADNLVDDPSGETARSILAHARTIAAAEAREAEKDATIARLREGFKAVVAESDRGIRECPVNNPALATGSQAACTKCGHGPDKSCPSLDGANYNALQMARAILAALGEQP